MRIRRSDSSRLEAFSDGVFAFAATLLVVSLEVPQTFDELLADLSGFGAFALGFGTLIMLWMVHNAAWRLPTARRSAVSAAAYLSVVVDSVRRAPAASPSPAS